MTADIERRFGGVGRLYGNDGALTIRSAHVCVVGIGGVGSWTVEALARSGVGRITAVDLDMVAESNTNRQIHAHEGTYGMAKIDAMAARVQAINPGCTYSGIEEFVTPENVGSLLPGDYMVLIDATDQVRAKAAMASWACERKLPIIMAGAAGGKTDPSQIRVADLSRTTQDPLLAKVRAQLRKSYGFNRDPKKKLGITAVYSLEPVRYPSNNECETNASPTGLNCAGFGSSVCVTATVGMIAAAETLRLLTARP